MKRVLLVSLALVALTAGTAFAGVDVQWGNCAPGGVADVTFDCTPGGSGIPYALFFSWEQPSTLAGFAAADYVWDLQADAASLPAFWDFKTPNSPASCNEFYILNKAKPGTCTASNIWGFNGGSVNISFGWGPQFGGVANRGRAVGSAVRTATTTATGGNDYFLMELDLFSDADPDVGSGGTCDGCGTPAAIVFNQVTLLSVADAQTGVEAAPIAVTGPGLVSQCATSGGASAICAATPTKNKTWGALKSLYR